jgi:hypothetical protein
MATDPQVTLNTQARHSNDRQQTEQLEYKPIKGSDEIRLLRIESGPEQCSTCATGHMLCTISHVSLSTSPVYEALSYVWGSTEKTHLIQCIDGSLLPVTANLHAALCRLRSAGRPRTLWVDAVCINQVDDAERTQQVRMMTRIYLEASKVLIWLGDEEEGDDIAFNFINQLSTQKETWEKDLGTAWAPWIPIAVQDSPLPRAVGGVLQRPWFRRVWVIQEAAMARKAQVICGSHNADWETLWGLIRHIQEKGLESSLGTTAFALMTISVTALVKDKRVANATPDPTLLQLLEMTQLCSSTDSRDRVFALLGIISDSRSVGVSVDYSIGCEELYEQVGIQGLVVRKDLSYLSFSGYKHSKLALPSWVPDWSINANPNPISPFSGQGFQASGGTEVKISLLEHSKTIVVVGYVIDVVEIVGTRSVGMREGDPFHETGEGYTKKAHNEREASKECDDISVIAQPVYPTGEPFHEVYWRIFICDRLASGEPAPPEFGKGFVLCHYILDRIDEIGEKHFENPDTKTIDGDGIGLQYGAAVMKWTSGRAFCATKGRYLGWVPRGTEKGDLICVIHGGEAPYILRPDPQGQGHYHIMGDCYIHGIMEGQAMARSDLIQQEFHIR